MSFVRRPSYTLLLFDHHRTTEHREEAYETRRIRSADGGHTGRRPAAAQLPGGHRPVHRGSHADGLARPAAGLRPTGPLTGPGPITRAQVFRMRAASTAA